MADKQDEQKIMADLAMACHLNAIVRNRLASADEEVERLIRHIDSLNAHVERVEHHANHIASKYESSLSWRVTKPLRSILTKLKILNV